MVIARGSDNKLRVLSLKTSQPEQVSDFQTTINGTVQSVQGGKLVIGGQTFNLSDAVLRTPPGAGRRAEITVNIRDGKPVITAVKELSVTTRSVALQYRGVAEADAKPEKDNVAWRVSGQSFIVTATTAIDAVGGELKKGSLVLVEAERSKNQFVAKRVTVLAGEAAAADAVEMQGVFQGVSGRNWQISGLVVEPPSGRQPPAFGVIIRVEGTQTAGTLKARSITVIGSATGEVLSVQGFLLEAGKDTWRIGTATIRILGDTHISGGSPAVGTRVSAWVRTGPNGSLEAIDLLVLDNEPVLPRLQAGNSASSQDAEQGSGQGSGNENSLSPTPSQGQEQGNAPGGN
jgi:hypothetical protein